MDPTVTSILVGACIGALSGRLNHRTIDVMGGICCSKEGKDNNNRFRSNTWQGCALDTLDEELWGFLHRQMFRNLGPAQKAWDRRGYAT